MGVDGHQAGIVDFLAGIIQGNGYAHSVVVVGVIFDHQGTGAVTDRKHRVGIDVNAQIAFFNDLVQGRFDLVIGLILQLPNLGLDAALQQGGIVLLRRIQSVEETVGSSNV